MSSDKILERLKAYKETFNGDLELPKIEDFEHDSVIGRFSTPTASAAQFEASMFKAENGSHGQEVERNIHELKRCWALCVKIEEERAKFLEQRRQQKVQCEKRNARLKASLDNAERDIAILKSKFAQAEANMNKEAPMLAITDADSAQKEARERRAHPSDTSETYYTFEEWIEFAKSIAKEGEDPQKKALKLWEESKVEVNTDNVPLHIPAGPETAPDELDSIQPASELTNEGEGDAAAGGTACDLGKLSPPEIPVPEEGLEDGAGDGEDDSDGDIENPWFDIQ